MKSSPLNMTNMLDGQKNGRTSGEHIQKNTILMAYVVGPKVFMVHT